SSDYVPGPEHTDDEIVVEDQPGAKDASPTVQSPDCWEIQVKRSKFCQKSKYC
ncbi:hypothetical protein Tco_0391847, partial [Tanacetum coccineum]